MDGQGIVHQQKDPAENILDRLLRTQRDRNASNSDTGQYIFAILTVLGPTRSYWPVSELEALRSRWVRRSRSRNILGGIFLLMDNALAVGDRCSISNRAGYIEDITLRSVKLRTEEQSLLSVPAGALAQSNIENLATRRKTFDADDTAPSLWSDRNSASCFPKFKSSSRIIAESSKTLSVFVWSVLENEAWRSRCISMS